ncbi:MAG TPA: phosphoribosyltransferase family protein [Terriglobales bacterium]|nr:phosphoribosyltransferase family protein [Terriglobales bacterium]
MSEQDGVPKNLKVLITAEQIQKRVHELARQIAKDYKDKTLYAVCVLENGFVFMADLVRALDIPVVCQFMKPEFSEKMQGGTPTTEIFFSPEIGVEGQHVLLVEALVQSGVTSEFLMRNLTGRGAATVKLATFLDKQPARRVSLQPDYFGFLIDELYVVGYGLGSPTFGRNLPYVAAAPGTGAAPGPDSQN